MSLLVPSAPRPRSPHDDLPGVEPEDVAAGRPGGPRLLLAAAAGSAGVLLVALAFRLQGQGSSQTGTAVLFWVGVLLGVLPSALILVRAAGTRSERIVALLLLGGVTAAPRLLRAAGPLFTDEYSSWRQTVDVIAGTTWHVRGGFVPGVEGYPGLHLLVGSVSTVSGLSIYAASVAVITLAHLVGAFAVFSLAGSLLGRDRTAGVAAALYLLNPLSLYVGMRLAPESLALPLLLAALALAVTACRVDASATRRGLGLAAGLLLALVALVDGTVALMAVVLLVVVVLAAVWRTRQHPVQLIITDGTVERRLVGIPEHPVLWGRLLATLGGALLVTSVALAATNGAFEQAADWFPSRGLAGMPGTAPVFEVVLTVLAPILILLAAAEGVWRLWSQPRRRSGRLLVLATLGVLYFPLVPLALLPTIAPAVRTGWGLTYLGVALLAAPVVLRRYDQLRARDAWVVDRVTAGPLAALVLAVVLIGNTAAGAGAGYRYTGPTRFGAEGRSDSAELRSIAETFAADNGRVGILADRYTGPAFAAWSGSRLARATTLLPGSELVQGVDPSVPGVTDLVRRGYTHLVVDVRMAGTTPVDGDSFGPRDVSDGYQTRQTALLRLDRVPWVSRVAASEHYRVYRIDLGGAGKPLVEQADAWGPDFRPLGTDITPAGLPASTAYAGPGLAPAATSAGPLGPLGAHAAGSPAAEGAVGGIGGAAAVRTAFGSDGRPLSAGAGGPAARSGASAGGHPAKPAAAKPGAAKRGTAKPGAAKPAARKPAPAKPTASKPAQSKPASSGPAKGKPDKGKPAKGKPNASKPAKARPEPSEPAKSRPAASGKPSKTPPGHADKGKSNQGHGNSANAHEAHADKGNQGHGNSGHGNSANAHAAHADKGNQGHANSGHGNSANAHAAHADKGNQGNGNQGNGNPNPQSNGAERSAVFATETRPDSPGRSAAAKAPATGRGPGDAPNQQKSSVVADRPRGGSGK